MYSAPIEERELGKVIRKAKRMFTRRQFRKPDETDRPYRAPQKQGSYRGIKYVCEFCERPTAYGSRCCRECFQKQVRAKHAAKVRAENERVSANERAFKTVTNKEEVMAKAKKDATPILRSTSGLRETMFQEMEALRSGESSWQRARSMAMLANTVLDSVKTEVEYHKYVASTPKTIETEENVKRLGTDIRLAA